MKALTKKIKQIKICLKVHPFIALARLNLLNFYKKELKKVIK